MINVNGSMKQGRRSHVNIFAVQAIALPLWSDSVSFACTGTCSGRGWTNPAATTPMGNKQVLLGFNRDPQKVQQYTCDSNENKMAGRLRGPARVMGLMAMPLTR